jgi:RNA polymerase sigma factor (sigma-70 family)
LAAPVGAAILVGPAATAARERAADRRPQLFSGFCSCIAPALRLCCREEEVQATAVSEARAKLEVLGTAFRPALVAFFVRRVRSTAEAEDMTQEIFMRLADADLDKIERPEAYLFTMASNLIRDRARRDRVQTGIKEDFAQQPGLGIEYLDPHRVAEGHEMLRSLEAGLAELPERTRHIFILYRVENVALKTIASQFGITVSAVEKHVRRAMRYLVERLGRGA